LFRFDFQWKHGTVNTASSEIAPETSVQTVTARLVVSAVVLGCIVGQSFGRFSFGLLLPAVKKDLNVSYGLAGWLGTMNLGAYAVGAAVTSAVSVRVAAHRILQAGIVLATVGIIILAIAPGTPVLLLGMMFCGIGGAASWVPAPGISAAHFPPHRRGFAMGLTSAGIGIGIVLATLLTNMVRVVVDNSQAWREVWGVQGAIGVVASVYAFRMIKPVAVSAGAPPKLSVLRQVPRWWAPTTAYVCFGLGYVLYAVFVVAALVQDAGFTNSHATRVFAFYGTGSALGALTIGRLSDRIGRRTTMIGCYLAAALPCFTVLTGREPFVSLGGLLFGMSMSGAVVSLAAHIGDNTRPQDFSAAFGVVTLCFGVAQTVGPRLGGWMADRNGNFKAVFMLAGFCWLVGGVCASGMRRSSSSRREGFAKQVSGCFPHAAVVLGSPEDVE
jgi:predicted MFS family arabinose efflux permease